MSMCVLVPSRGRPSNIARLANAWRDTGATAQLVVLIDNDDPELVAYDRAREEHGFTLVIGEPSRIGPILSDAAPRFAEHYDVVGFMGDDHLPRTEGWDARIEAFSSPWTVVYGNDLLQGVNLATQVFIGAGVVRAWGRFTPPGCEHLYLDNAWMAIGQALGTLTYLDDVVIEHLHFINGKADRDELYEAVNAPSMYDHDRAAFQEWIGSGQADQDVQRIRLAMAEATS